MRHESGVPYEEILKLYRLKLDYVEDYGKVKKVYTNHGSFALKKVDNYSRQSDHFIQTMIRLKNSGFTKMIFPYSAPDGRYIVHYGRESYYLMPWLPNDSKEERDARYHKLFRELAHLHSVSSGEVKIKREDVKNQHEILINQWNEQSKQLEKYVTECEQKMYMSPFELYFCTFYHETSKAIEFARDKLNEWYEIIKEKEKARLVTIHGRPSVKHYLYDENGNGYFVNFEASREASPIYDLISFYFRALKTYPLQGNESYEWFTTYQQHFTLREEELLLLYCYLAFPESIIRVVNQYRMKQRAEKSEEQHVCSLVSSYWHMKNIEQFLMRVLEAEQQKKLAAEQAQNQAD